MAGGIGGGREQAWERLGAFRHPRGSLPASGASGAEETQVGVELVGAAGQDPPGWSPCTQRLGAHRLSLAGGADDAWADSEDITEEDCALRSVPRWYGLGWRRGRVSDRWWPFSN